MARPIRKWVVCVSGFLQNRSKPTGMLRLWRDLHGVVGPDAQLLLLNWNDDAAEYAELIWQFAQESPDPSIAVFGYSWGGMTAVHLARELERRGMGVGCMVLSDPVYRHWWWPRRWTSLVRWVEIEIPANVKRVGRFYQQYDKPAGHKLKLADPEQTRVVFDCEVVRSHVYMDDLLPFHEECRKCAVA